MAVCLVQEPAEPLAIRWMWVHFMLPQSCRRLTNQPPTSSMPCSCWMSSRWPLLPQSHWVSTRWLLHNWCQDHAWALTFVFTHHIWAYARVHAHACARDLCGGLQCQIKSYAHAWTYVHPPIHASPWSLPMLETHRHFPTSCPSPCSCLLLGLSSCLPMLNQPDGI